MQNYREKVLASAAKRFAGIECITDSSEVSARLRSFIKLEDQRLRMAHRCGATGSWTAETRSFIIDAVVQTAFATAAYAGWQDATIPKASDSFAVVGLGGYGRGELAPYSDVDLLFLHGGLRGGSNAVEMRRILERILRYLWDAGLTVGHSFRTIRECISASRDDLHLQTALISNRLLAGSRSLFDRLTGALEPERKRRSHSFISAIQEEREQRYGRFGDAICLQEPNVKEGAGGIRDLHTALWLAYARHGCRTLAEMQAHDLITSEERKIAERAYDFLLSVRYRMHLLTARKVERVALDLQPALAEEFGYTSDDQLLASERFMRDYYRNARELYLFGESVVARIAEPDALPSRWFSWQRSVPPSEPFSIKDRKIHLEHNGELFAKNPLMVLSAFALAQAARVTFGHSLEQAMRKNLAVVNRQFRGSVEVSNAFLSMLRRRGRVGHVLRLMHEVGFLGRFLPEFGRISLLIQHDLYHHYTIDEHTLKVIEALDELYNSQDIKRAHLRAIFDEVEDPTLLYLSLLLHDIGKGQGRGHVPRGVKISERVCRRLQLTKDEAAKVVLLVKHHITMAHISQRRDLTEPHVAADFSTQIGGLDALNMLLLLSYSDMNGVGPGVWSDWKGNLLWELYERTRVHMTSSDAPPHGLVQLAHYKETILNALAGAAPLSDVERHLALLPDRYVRTTTPDGAASHLRMIELLNKDVLSWNWTAHGRATTELVICTRDRHGLFADIAGTLTAQGVEILRAEINTREDGIAIDTFMLRDAATHHAVEERRFALIERALRAAIKGEADVAALVEKWRTHHAPRRRKTASSGRRLSMPVVACDNQAAESATVVEVRAHDEPGLAYKIASVASSLGFEIVYAKITTEKSDAFDVFYMTDGDGRRLSEEAMKLLQAATLERLSTASRNETGTAIAKLVRTTSKTALSA